MERWLTVSIAAAALALAAGCADSPKPYRSIPRANPKKVAIGAAAVAGALTLAGAPSRGGPKKEKPGQGEKRPQKSQGSVPSDVLDRLDDTPAPDPDEDDCERDDQAKKKVELIPTDDGSTLVPPPKKRCKDDDSDEDDESPESESK